MYIILFQTGFLSNDSILLCGDTSSLDSDSSEECSSGRTAETIFEELGDVTAHKAARLGIKMNGKLKRLQDHEDKYIESRRKSVKKDDEDMKSKVSKPIKKKKRKSKNKL